MRGHIIPIKSKGTKISEPGKIVLPAVEDVKIPASHTPITTPTDLSEMLLCMERGPSATAVRQAKM
jgi:hypothetical protein